MPVCHSGAMYTGFIKRDRRLRGRTAGRRARRRTCGPSPSGSSPCGANCCRCRTVSATMSKRPESEPPIWRWIVTAVITNVKFSEPTRSAMLASASSIGLPSCVSVSTRLNSLRGRLGALLDDRLDALPEAVAGLERRRHRDQQVGQLVLELARRGSCALNETNADRARRRRSPSARASAATTAPSDRAEQAEHEARRRRRSRAARRARSGRSARSISRCELLELLDVREARSRSRRRSVRALPRGPPGAARSPASASCREVRLDARADACRRGVRRTRSSSESRIRPPTTAARGRACRPRCSRPTGSARGASSAVAPAEAACASTRAMPAPGTVAVSVDCRARGATTVRYESCHVRASSSAQARRTSLRGR